MPRQIQQKNRRMGEKASSDGGPSPNTLLRISLLIVSLGLVAYIAATPQPYLYADSSSLAAILATKVFDPDANAAAMGRWRKTLVGECDKMMATSPSLPEKLRIEQQAMSQIELPATKPAGLPLDHRHYEYCRNTFIDLGTNIGDSIGYFVDNSFDACTPIWMKNNPKQRMDEKFPRVHLDVTDLIFHNEGVKKGNPLAGMLQRQLEHEKYGSVGPESFCVYGMEGNPEFTERLQKLENFVMDMQPRPVRHLHIHTESVITAVDGPTKLYLDKTSVKENFWGSSILSSQQDAQKSARELNNGEVFAADVQGISLSQLVKNTMLPYKPTATEEEKSGGLLIIKMDVEGAEYQVLKEVAQAGVLCDYIKQGNRIYFIVEYHNMSITDPTERKREKAGADKAKETLQKCGVEFGNLQAMWH